MSRWYRFMYKFGFTPWEEDTESQAAQLGSLLSHVEGEREPPFGTALDLGCGTGRFSIELARRGWTSVGIDVVPDAIEIARQRAHQAGVDATFVEGNVTELRKSSVGDGFSLILDAECFNHLNDSQRESVHGGTYWREAEGPQIAPICAASAVASTGCATGGSPVSPTRPTCARRCARRRKPIHLTYIEVAPQVEA